MLCNPQAASMTASDTPSLVLRNTSLTMRQRFTPARSCSTWTRICASFRLVRFSTFVSSPRGGFFFRLAGLLHRRLIALESGILVQGGLRRVADPFLIGYLFVLRLAGARSAEVVNPSAPGVDDDHVLVAMLLLAPAVKKGLFFGVFRPLAAPLGGVDDQPGRFPGGALGLGKVRCVPLGEDPRANALQIAGFPGFFVNLKAKKAPQMDLSAKSRRKTVILKCVCPGEDP